MRPPSVPQTLFISKLLALAIVVSAVAKAEEDGTHVPPPPPGHPTFEDPITPKPPHVPGPPTTPQTPHAPGTPAGIVPTIKEQYQCGADEGEIYDDGVNKFELRCDYGAYVGDISSHPSTTLKECVDLCAKNVACFGADWNWSNGVCHVKGEEFPGSPNNEHHQWYPVGNRKLRSCPPDRLSEPKTDPLIVTDPKCPDDNGDIFQLEDGSFYIMLCCTENPGSELPGTRSNQETFKDCGEKCSTTAGCQSYVYTSPYAGAAETPGTCKLYGSGGFQTEASESKSNDYAYLVEPPAIQLLDELTEKCSTECPSGNGNVFESVGGEVFHIDCGKRHGTQIIYSDTLPTLKDCMNACSMLNPCHSVDYHANSNACYFGNHHGEPTIEASGFQSAHSLGCAGGCDKKKCCSQESSSSAQ